jgi:cell division protein FtsB
MRFKQAGFLTKIVVVVLLIYMATSLLDLRTQIREAEEAKVTLEEQVKQQQLENQQLAAAIANSDDPDMLEQVAREKGYVKANETIYINIAS